MPAVKTFAPAVFTERDSKVPLGSRVVRRNLNGFVAISSLRRRATNFFPPHGLQEAESDI